MYKRKITGKHILTTVLAAVIAFPMLLGGSVKDLSKAQAATKLNNPSKASNGVVTWDCVYFGRYPQSDATGAKKDAIKWRVLSVNGNDAFLIADCNLDAQFYHEKWADITWKDCTMRSWLNGYGYDSNASNADYRKNNFMDTAFADTEQKAILTTTVVNSDNAYYKTTGGDDTKDKVFLLSLEEASDPAYGFSSSDVEDPAKVRLNTDYVEVGGSSDSPITKAAGMSDLWWLRTPGQYSTNATYIGRTGFTVQDGTEVDMRYAVCPALHLDLSNSKVWSYAGTVGSDGSSTPGEEPPTVEVPIQDPNTGETYVKTDTTGKDKAVEYHQASENSSETVTIPGKITIKGTTYNVTSVADNAFKNNKKVKKVIIGENVKTIGANAFMGCSNLQTVTMGKNVTTIKSKAFYKCTKLKSITLPSKLKTIGNYAFYKCTKLKKITIPFKVKKIGKQAFYGCKNLKTLTVKTTMLTSKKVGSKAFKGIHSKATVKVPSKKFLAYKKLLKSKGVGSKAKFKK